jgi:hypothetical protein
MAMEAVSDETSGASSRGYRSALGTSSSGFHDLTVQTLDVANVDIALLLGLLDEATAASSVLAEPDTAVWRSTNGAGFQEHLLVIRRVPDGYYDSVLASRSTEPAGSPWRQRLAGSYTPGTSPGQGQGSMWIDFDTDLDDATSGKLLVLWSTLGGEREIDVFRYVLSTEGGVDAPRNQTSGFHENADLSGTFVFSAMIAIPENDRESSTEVDALIVSRWTPQFEGRSDAHVSGVAATERGFDEEVASQCWKALGKVTTYDAIVGQRNDHAVGGKVDHKVLKSQGRVEDCPFLDSADALLPSRPAEPSTPPLPEQAD